MAGNFGGRGFERIAQALAEFVIGPACLNSGASSRYRGARVNKQHFPGSATPDLGQRGAFVVSHEPIRRKTRSNPSRAHNCYYEPCCF